MMYESNYLMHYRTKGSKNGVRRFQNEDGSLTAEGREHYGVGDPRQASGLATTGSNASSGSSHKYSVRKYGKSSAKMLGKKPEVLDAKQKAERDAKRKKIIAAAAGTAIAAIGIGIAVKQHQKMTRNLMVMAMNKVNNEYKHKQNVLFDSEKYFSGKTNAGAEQKLNANRSRAILKIQGRTSAKKALGLSGRENREKYRKFVADNNLRKIKTSELMEKMSGQKLVEGKHVVIRNGQKRLEDYSERKRRKMAEGVMRSYFNARRGV